MSTLFHPALASTPIAEVEIDWAATPLLSGLLKDLCDWLGTAWAMAIRSFDGELRTACTFGTPPSRRECADYILSLARRDCRPHEDWQLHVLPPDVRRGLPRLVASSRNDHGTCALAFGPKRQPGEYSVSDCTLVLDAVAQISALMSRKRLARYVAASMQERQCLCDDMAAAREVQRLSLPSHGPHVKGIDCYGDSLPARELGGDFYDFMAVDEDSLALWVGDVSGHGISSALLMSGIQAYARGLTSSMRADPKLVVSELNRISADISPDNFFTTLFYARIDPVLNQIQYVNAGHGPALLIRRDRTVAELESTGTVLGLSSESRYLCKMAQVFPGDTLVVSTDGVYEHEDASGPTFAQDVLKAVGNGQGSRARDIVDAILDYSNGRDLGSRHRDDKTVVVVRFKETTKAGIIGHELAEETVVAA